MCMKEVIVKTRIGVKEANLDWRKKTTTTKSKGWWKEDPIVELQK
jgi:hypothetical protein